jgi:hypothetical protein
MVRLSWSTWRNPRALKRSEARLQPRVLGNYRYKGFSYCTRTCQIFEAKNELARIQRPEIRAKIKKS